MHTIYLIEFKQRVNKDKGKLHQQKAIYILNRHSDNLSFCSSLSAL